MMWRRKRRNETTVEIFAFVLWALQSCHGFAPPLHARARGAAIEANSFVAKSVLQTASSDVIVANSETAAEEVDFEEWVNVDEEVENQDLLIPFAPPLSFEKFVTMQEKRVVVTVRYSQGLKAFYLTVAKRIKDAHPDVLIEKLIMPALDDGGDGPTFEVLVDGKVVLPRGRSRKQQTIESHDASVYVSMYELDLAIAKARRKRRPSTLYGDERELHMFRKSEGTAVAASGPTKKWKD